MINSSKDRFQVLLCRAGESLCAIPLEKVLEVMRSLPLEALAGSPDYVKGVSIVRGSPLPVVDLAKLVGTKAGGGDYFISIRAGTDRRAVLCVDRLLGIRFLEERALEAAPKLLEECHPEMVSSIRSLDEDLLLVLEAGKVIPESLWSAL